MSLTRVLGRASRTNLTQCRGYLLSPASPVHHPNYSFSLLCNHFHSRSEVSSKINISKIFHSFIAWVTRKNSTASHLRNGLRSVVAFKNCGMSTFASPEQEQGTPTEKKGNNGGADASKQAGEGSSTEDSEGDMDDLSREDLVKIVLEKEEVLENKQKEFAEFKDKFLRSYAEMENVMERTRRDAENSKKFAVQSFAKNLLDVADNLGRAASVTRESLKKIDVSQDTVGAMPLLKTLLEGVEMTDKQLAEVFRKAGIEKYDPTNEQFDPNRHNAVFQVPDNSKPPETVAVVLKAGYTLHDRIIRPAEVGVTIALEKNEADS
ncbi:grpE protein homolog 1, mitochondrial isoform X2 [Spinacia oleracea]|uniref:GrpE protein homolog n=1 Tax=Spinacia oleracea TaxID=3562 RepID=A0A9R0JVV1_SPIOL|nr:grpE protein homolog 1, mitochondrial isoform X2 [Spinacia oleracea]